MNFLVKKLARILSGDSATLNPDKALFTLYDKTYWRNSVNSLPRVPGYVHCLRNVIHQCTDDFSHRCHDS